MSHAKFSAVIVRPIKNRRNLSRVSHISPIFVGGLSCSIARFPVLFVTFFLVTAVVCCLTKGAFQTSSGIRTYVLFIPGIYYNNSRSPSLVFLDIGLKLSFLRLDFCSFPRP